MMNDNQVKESPKWEKPVLIKLSEQIRGGSLINQQETFVTTTDNGAQFTGGLGS